MAEPITLKFNEVKLTGLLFTVIDHCETKTLLVPAYTEVPTEDEAKVTVAMDGLETEVTVMVLPTNGKLPDGVTATLEESTATTSEAAFKLNETVLPAVKPVAGSIANESFLVWPALTPRFNPENTITPLDKELYCVKTLPFSTK